APGKPHFWQKHTPVHYPSWIPRVNFPTERGRDVEYVLVNDRAALQYLVNQGTMTFHPWLSRIQDPDRPDFVLFDLDPGPATFSESPRNCTRSWRTSASRRWRKRRERVACTSSRSGREGAISTKPGSGRARSRNVWPRKCRNGLRLKSARRVAGARSTSTYCK